MRRMPKQFIVHISGPGCSGKSSLAAELGERFPGTYLVAYDKLKWQLSGYKRITDGDLVRSIELELFEIICKKKISMFTIFNRHTAPELEKCDALAKESDYSPVLYVQLEAPEDVLISRFRERVKSAKEMGTKVSLTDESLFREKLTHDHYSWPGKLVFDTSVTDVKEIADRIEKIIAE